MNGICKVLDRFYGAVPADDCDGEWFAVTVARDGNQIVIGRYDTEEEAEAAADAAHESDLADNGQFGVGA